MHTGPSVVSLYTQQLPSLQIWPLQQMVSVPLVPAVPHFVQVPG
jgi:hypothetical protein